MDNKKIGAFIAAKRKEKGLTQEQLGEKLGVTNKTVSRWENGNYMPDLSLLEPLSKELGITLNELLAGESLEQQPASAFSETSEKNLQDAIHYGTQKIQHTQDTLAFLLMGGGILVCVCAFVWSSGSSLGAFSSIIGLLLLALGVFQKLRQLSLRKRILIPAGLFLLSVFVLFFADYVGVSVCNRLPVFCYATQSITPAGTGMITYHNPFYRVYRINVGTENEYRIIDTAKKYTEESVPFSPFNRNQCGISQLRKYKSPYIGDNSNTGGLINALPLSEHGFVFEIDAKNCGLTVNYHFTDWYGNNDGYVEKSLIYNSVSIFCLIDNVQYITYHFSGSTYRVTRADMEQNYPDFNEITASHQINEEAFHKYVEEKMTDEAFIRSIFTLFEKEQA